MTVWPGNGNPGTVHVLAKAGYLRDLSDQPWVAKYPKVVSDVAQYEGDNGQQPNQHQRECPDDHHEQGHERDERLRDCRDPADLTCRIGAEAMAVAEPARDQHHRERDRDPPRDRVQDDEEPFDDGDPECDPHPPRAQPAAGAAAAVLEGRPRVERSAVLHLDQPYQAGTVSQVRPNRFAARRAARAGSRCRKRP